MSKPSFRITQLELSWLVAPGAVSGASQMVAFNPLCRPGVLVVGGSCAGRDSIGGQVASKLATTHFLEGVLDQFGASPAPDPFSSEKLPEETAVQILETAFQRANSSVYSFGHKLAAAGRMAASLLGLSIVDGMVAAGRVGEVSAFLLRGGDIFPFFEAKERTEEQQAHSHEQLVGAHSLVSVELSSVPLEGGDLVLCFSENLTPSRERRLSALAAAGSFRETRAVDAVLGKLWGGERWPVYAVLVAVGPRTLYLNQRTPEKAGDGE